MSSFRTAIRLCYAHTLTISSGLTRHIASSAVLAAIIHIVYSDVVAYLSLLALQHLLQLTVLLGCPGFPENCLDFGAKCLENYGDVLDQDVRGFALQDLIELSTLHFWFDFRELLDHLLQKEAKILFNRHVIIKIISEDEKGLNRGFEICLD